MISWSCSMPQIWSPRASFAFLRPHRYCLYQHTDSSPANLEIRWKFMHLHKWIVQYKNICLWALLYPPIFLVISVNIFCINIFVIFYDSFVVEGFLITYMIGDCITIINRNFLFLNFPQFWTINISI